MQKDKISLLPKRSRAPAVFIRNGHTATRAIAAEELKGQHSSTYLWEQTTFKDDPNNIYLLVVDMEQHPGTDVHISGTIAPS